MSVQATTYELSNTAACDFREIALYTKGKWGTSQARKYIATISNAIEDMAGDQIPVRAITLDDGRELHYIHNGHHYIYGLKRKRKPMLIIAVLHEKMDLMQRLTNRL